MELQAMGTDVKQPELTFYPGAETCSRHRWVSGEAPVQRAESLLQAMPSLCWEGLLVM